MEAYPTTLRWLSVHIAEELFGWTDLEIIDYVGACILCGRYEITECTEDVRNTPFWVPFPMVERTTGLFPTVRRVLALLDRYREDIQFGWIGIDRDFVRSKDPWCFC